MSSEASRVLNLRDIRDWNLERLLAPKLSQLWGDSPVISVGELVELKAAYQAVAESEPVVGPGSVDANTGAVCATRTRNANKLVFRVRRDGSDIRVDDVLLPLTGTGPAVMIAAEHSGLCFTNFVALRPQHRTVGLWLWAVLSSLRGVHLRRAISAGSTIPRVALTSLAAAPVPKPRPRTDPLYRDLADLHAAAGIAPTSEGRTWWRVVSLAEGGDWHHHLATPHPEIFDQGTPLGDLATVVAGRNPRLWFETARPGTVPVLSGRSVSGNRIGRWAEPGSGPEAQPGDVAAESVNLFEARPVGIY